MNAHKLRLALEKTEALRLPKKRGYRKPMSILESQQITTKNLLRYLGVEIDAGWRFKVHETVGVKATKTAQALSRISPNVGQSREICWRA